MMEIAFIMLAPALVLTTWFVVDAVREAMARSRIEVGTRTIFADPSVAHAITRSIERKRQKLSKQKKLKKSRAQKMTAGAALESNHKHCAHRL